MTAERAELSSAIHEKILEMVVPSVRILNGVFDTLKAMVRMILGDHDIQLSVCGLDGQMCGRTWASDANLTWSSSQQARNRRDP